MILHGLIMMHGGGPILDAALREPVAGFKCGRRIATNQLGLPLAILPRRPILQTRPLIRPPLRCAALLHRNLIAPPFHHLSIGLMGTQENLSKAEWEPTRHVVSVGQTTSK